MSPPNDLRGRAALVTGAGRRLGRAFAEALARSGSSIAVHYGGSSAGALEVVEYARKHGVRAIAIQANLAEPDEIQGLIPWAVESLGGLDILVNSAAIFESLNAFEADLEAWDRHLRINLTAPFMLSRELAIHLRGRHGAIVNLLDWRALRPGPDHLPYTIAKAGLAALTRSLAQSFAPNIRVNGLSLGAILPPPGAKGKSQELIKGLPAGRWGTVEEAAQALLFLIAGPDFITGEILNLDGGRLLY